jgi:sugar phosphate isomerase/epimerase
MTVGQIGDAVCRLMKAGDTLRLTREALAEDQAAVLCDNPRCEDCVRQRAAIKAARLATEPFTLSAVVDDVFPIERLGEALWEIKAEGISALEVGRTYACALARLGPDGLADFARQVAVAGCRVAVWPCLLDWGGDEATLIESLKTTAADARLVGAPFLKLVPWIPAGGSGGEVPGEVIATLRSLAAAAEGLRTTLLIENHPAAHWSTQATCRAVLEGANSPALRLALNPAHFAHVGEKPFLSTWNRGRLKRFIAQLMIADGCGRQGWPAYTPPARGQGEVKELMSIMRCRSFPGLFTLTTSGSRDFGFRAETEGFWRCLDTL